MEVSYLICETISGSTWMELPKARGFCGVVACVATVWRQVLALQEEQKPAFMNLEQQPLVMEYASERMPCLVRRGIYWSSAHQRPLLPREKLGVHLLPTRAAYSHAMGLRHPVYQDRCRSSCAIGLHTQTVDSADMSAVYYWRTCLPTPR